MDVLVAETFKESENSNMRMELCMMATGWTTKSMEKANLLNLTE